MNYSLKLSDPRWQKKRLLIFERDNWTCVRCGATDKTLHVHHEKYSGEPWNAPDHCLKTLCETCHSNEHRPSNAPSLETLRNTRLELLDKIELSSSASARNTWRQAVSIIESQAQEIYGTDLTTLKKFG